MAAYGAGAYGEPEAAAMASPQLQAWQADAEAGARLSLGELKALCGRTGVRLTDQQLITLTRKFGSPTDGSVAAAELLKQLGL